MKKIFIALFAILGFVASVKADETQSALTFQWAHSVDGATTGGDNVMGMCKSSDGYYYVATNFGTSTTQNAMNVWFDGEQLKDKYGFYEGSPYTGTSQNGNMLLQKVAKDGSVVWTTFTNKGDVDHSATQIAPTSDGGVIIALKCRAWVEDAGLINLLCYVNPKGAEQRITSDQVKSEYRYLIMKITKAGKIGWYRIISGLVKTYDETHATKNNIYINGLAVDEKDNIYLAGNFRTEMYLNKADGTSATLVAKSSIDSWGGDSQNVVGDMFLVKLDSKGYYLNSIVNDGIVDCAFLDKVAYNDGKLYLDGRVRSVGNDITFGGVKVNASKDFQTQLLLSVSTENLAVNYIKSLTSVENVQKRFVIQNKSAQYLNGYVYFTGLLNGSWKQESESENIVTNHDSKQLKGYVLKMNPETGKVEKATVRTDGGIGGFFGVYEGAEKLYAFGYDFSGGAIVAPINKNTYAVETPIQVCDYGIVGNATAPIVDGENFIMANRGGIARATDNTVSFYGTDKKFENLNCWGSVYYSYKMSDVISTGINKPTISGVDSDTFVDVYTIGGVKVKSGVAAGNATEGLAKGIYIVNHKKVIVK